MEKKNINNIVYSILVYIFYLALIYYLSSQFDLQRDWLAHPDQDLHIIYNALLFNSGLEQETRSAGYFTYLFFSIIVNVLYFFKLIPVYDINSSLNNESINSSFQDIIFFGRLFSISCISFLFLAFYWLFSYLSKDKFVGALVPLLLIFSNGTIDHLYHIRTEVISAIFFVMAFLFLIIMLKKNLSNPLYYLILFLIFFYSAQVQKALVIFYLPIVLFLVFFFKEQPIKFRVNGFDFINNKKFKLLIIFITFLYFLTKLLTNTGDILSIIFLIVNIVIFNSFIYFVSEKNHEKSNLIILNVTIFFSIVFYKSLLSIHPSSSRFLFIDNFTTVLSYIAYTKQYLLNDSHLINLTNAAVLLMKNFFLVLTNIMGNISIYSILIFIYIVLTLLLIKKITKNDLIIISLSILSFFLISSFNYLRYTELGLYNIFSDFFLIIPLCCFLSNFKKEKYLFLIVIILVVNTIGYPFYKNKVLVISKMEPKNLCEVNSDYMKDLIYLNQYFLEKKICN